MVQITELYLKWEKETNGNHPVIQSSGTATVQIDNERNRYRTISKVNEDLWVEMNYVLLDDGRIGDILCLKHTTEEMYQMMEIEHEN